MKTLSRYLAIVGTALLIQGIIIVLLNAFSITLTSPWSRAIRPDVPHAVVHIVWGGLIWLGLKQNQARLTGLTFGAFYLLFGLLGVVADHPWGLLLDRGENGFHLLVGAIALILLGQGISRT
jgi:hypothetical protein